MSEQDVVPRWRCIKRAKVGLEAAASDGERAALADSVGSHKPKQSHWQPVKSKVIGAVRVRHSSELARQVNELHAAAGSMLTPCEARRAGLLSDCYSLFYLYASSVTVMHGLPHLPALKKCQAWLTSRGQVVACGAWLSSQLACAPWLELEAPRPAIIAVGSDPCPVITKRGRMRRSSRRTGRGRAARRQPERPVH